LSLFKLHYVIYVKTHFIKKCHTVVCVCVRMRVYFVCPIIVILWKII